MLTDASITFLPGPDGEPVATLSFLLSAGQASAVDHAVADLLRARHRDQVAETADEVLASRRATVLADQVSALAATALGGALRANAEQAAFLSAAADRMVAAGAEQSYQSPEMRERVRLLDELAEQLRDGLVALRTARPPAPVSV